MVSTANIIAAVKRNPDLWCTKRRRFASNADRQRMWMQLAVELNVDEDFLKKRWKNIKDQYRKELKKLTLDPTADPDEVINWSYFSQLEFLRDEVLKRPYRAKQDYTDDEIHEDQKPEISFVEFTDNEDDDQQTSDNNSEPTSSKRARITINEPLYDPEPEPEKEPNDTKLYDMCNKIVGKLQGYLKVHEDKHNMESKDADLCFFKSMLPNVRKLNEYQKLQFRGKVIQSLLECLGQEGGGHSQFDSKIDTE